MSSENFDLSKHTQEQKLDLIIKLLIGNPLDKSDDGLVGDIRATKKRIYQLEQWRTKIVSWAIGVGFGSGSVLTYVVTQLLKK